jgi:hypothetical protein
MHPGRIDAIVTRAEERPGVSVAVSAAVHEEGAESITTPPRVMINRQAPFLRGCKSEDCLRFKHRKLKVLAKRAENSRQSTSLRRLKCLAGNHAAGFDYGFWSSS